MTQLLSNFSNIADADISENVSDEISVQYVDGAVVVSGSSEAAEMTAVITDDDAVVSAAEVKAISTATVKDGKFCIKMILGNDFDSGNYTVWVSDVTTAAEDYNVYVLDEFDKQEYAEDIADMSADDLKLFFENEDNKKILDGIGIISDRPQNLTGLYAAIEAVELTGSYAEIAKSINTEIALAITKEKGFVYGISSFNDYFEIDTTDSLHSYVSANNLLDEAQAFMENKFVDAAELNTEIFNSFKLAVFTNALSVEYAQEFAGLNNDYFGFDFEGDYRVLNKINKKNVISAAMTGENIDDIRDKFEQAAKEYKIKQQRAQNDSASGSGSGSGGGGGGTIAPPKLNVELPEVKVDSLKVSLSY